MNRQNRIAAGRCTCFSVRHQGTLVDHLLRTAFNLRVAALNGVKIKLRSVGTGCHGTGRAAAHANAHAGATQLNQQTARREDDFLGLGGVDRAQATRNHDRFVVAPLFGGFTLCSQSGNALLVLPKITQQVGPPKFVVEGCATQRPFDHDLQRTGNVLGLAVESFWR